MIAAANVRYTSATEMPRRTLNAPERRARSGRAAARSAPRRGTGRPCDRRPGRTPSAKNTRERKPDQLDPARNLDPRRRAGRSAHRVDRTRAAAAGCGTRSQPRHGRLRRTSAPYWLMSHAGSGTVPPMSPPRAHRAGSAPQASFARHPEAPARRSRRRRRGRASGVLLVTAFGGGDHPAASLTAPASASRLLPAGPPEPPGDRAARRR